jgi:Mg-chelatase subunit ChlI
MRRGLTVFLAVVTLGLLTALAVFSWNRERSTPMRWLRTEFSLDEREAESVARIHAEYEIDCARMCARIAQTDERLAALIGNSQTVTSEIQEAIIETDRLRSECRINMLKQFYRIAAELPADKRDEYLAVVLPSVLRPEEMARSHLR